MSAPAVAVSADGKKLAMAWKDMRLGEPNIYWTVSEWPEFQKGTLLHSNTKGVQDHPSLAIDNQGIAWAVWKDRRDGATAIRGRSSQNETNWVISDPSEGSVSFPVIAVADGVIAVVYESGNRNKNQVQFRLLQTSTD